MQRKQLWYRHHHVDRPPFGVRIDEIHGGRFECGFMSYELKKTSGNISRWVMSTKIWMYRGGVRMGRQGKDFQGVTAVVDCLKSPPALYTGKNMDSDDNFGFRFHVNLVCGGECYYAG